MTATLDRTWPDAITVNLSYSGTATGSGTDYTGGATIVISAGSTTGTTTVTAAERAEQLEVRQNFVREKYIYW